MLKKSLLLTTVILAACTPPEHIDELQNLSAADLALMSCTDLSMALSKTKQTVGSLGTQYQDAALKQNEFQDAAYEFANIAQNSASRVDMDFAQAGAGLSVIGMLASQGVKMESENVSADLTRTAQKIIQTQRAKGCR